MIVNEERIKKPEKSTYENKTKIKYAKNRQEFFNYDRKINIEIF